MRRVLSLLLVALLVPAALIAGGCKDLPSAAAIRSEIEREIPGARFERDSHIRLGRVALAFVKPIARWSLDEDDEARAILSGVRKVDISSYRVSGLPDSVDRKTLRGLEGRMVAHGWSQIVHASDGDDNTWLFSRASDSGSIRGILVVELDDDELTIVGVEGRLDEVLARALADEPGQVMGLFGS